MEIEEKIFPGKIKVIAKFHDITSFGIFGYSVRVESIHIIVLWDQLSYVPGLTKDFSIVYHKELSHHKDARVTL